MFQWFAPAAQAAQPSPACSPSLPQSTRPQIKATPTTVPLLLPALPSPGSQSPLGITAP